MKLPADDGRCKAHPTKPRGMVTNNGTKHDAIVSRFDQSGMTMKAAAEALGTNITQIGWWRAGGYKKKGRFLPTNPAKQGDLDNRMGTLMSPFGPPPACGPPSSFFHVGGPSAY